MIPESHRRIPRGPLVAAGVLAASALIAVAAEEPLQVLQGKAAYGDWRENAPGTRHLIRASDMPPAFATGANANRSNIVARPAGVMPKAPPGFAVSALASGFDTPRWMTVAPNGDVFLAESGAGNLRILREGGKVAPVFASGLHRPFGIAFYPPGPNPEYVYVADTDAVLRFPYRNGDQKASGEAQTIVGDLPTRGHWTRNIVFAPDGKTMYLAVGSSSNVAEGNVNEERRANILEYDPDGKFRRVFASGIRNPVGIALYPGTNELWAAVNERDGMGDDLPPDYVTHVAEGGFYGWPWYYIGNHPDPRHKGAHPELASSVLTPDVLLAPHSAPLGLAVYTGSQFPAEYKGDLFVAAHGSWNREKRTGYKIVRIRMKDGKATGEYDDFVTGLVVSDSDVWGRPVGVASAPDGSLLFSDDGSGTVWRVSYGDAQGPKPTP